MICRVIFATLLSLVFSAPAGAFELEVPIGCQPGKDCFIQNYVDLNYRENAKSYHDYTCGIRSYDGHEGTDFRVADEAAMEAGTKVLAAAGGTVTNLRDGMKDITIRDISHPRIKGSECGNNVLVTHKDGWTTKYCHLKNGSIHVRKGESVNTGDVLGEVGLSGETEFPHLHLTLRHYGDMIDPFTGLMQRDCEQPLPEESNPLWSKAAMAQLPYVSTGIISTGFTSRPPVKRDIEKNGNGEAWIVASAERIAFWVYGFGLRQGDQLIISLQSPKGKILQILNQRVSQNKSSFYYPLSIVREGVENWPEGMYEGRVKIYRADEKGNKSLALEQVRKVSVGAVITD